MIQINLIPDVKQEMLRAQRVRNTAIGLSIFAALAAGGIVVLLGVLVGLQTVHENWARGEIASQFGKLKSVPDIDNALTIQNQLTRISDLNKNKSVTSRILDVINAINPPAPNNIRYSTVSLDPTTKTLAIEATATGGFPATDTFRKLILNTKVESVSDGSSSSTPLADSVVLSDTSYGESSDGTKIMSFKASFVYPDGLFDNTLSNVRIVTPTSQIDVTDSRTRVPVSLFGEAPIGNDDGNGGTN
ncbi:MAG: hypothetical protein KA604_01880 [Candidatus Saccharimonas sp.]|jgi:hypothetical protein|nr:hypothetical protein [Candidatus Saccharimonas sp.]